MKDNYTTEFQDGYDLWANELELQREYEEDSDKSVIALRIKNESDRYDYLMCCDMSDYDMGVFYYGGEERGA